MMTLDLRRKIAALEAAPRGTREWCHAEIDVIRARQRPRLTEEEEAISREVWDGRMTREEGLRRLAAIGSHLA